MKDTFLILVILALGWMVLTDTQPSELPSVDEAMTTVEDVAATVNDGLGRVKQANQIISETTKIEIINPVEVELQPTPTLAPSIIEMVPATPVVEMAVLDMRATAQAITEQMATPTLEPTKTAVIELVGNVPTPVILQNGGLPQSMPYSQNEQWQCKAMSYTGAIERLPEPQKTNCKHYTGGK